MAVLKMNAAHYRLQSDIIYTFWGYNITHTVVNAIAVFDFKVATKQDSPKLFHYYPNPLIFIRLRPNSALGWLFCICSFPCLSVQHFWCDQMEWHLNICNNFILFFSFRLNALCVHANFGFRCTFFHVCTFIAKRILLITVLLHSVLIFRHHANEEHKKTSSHFRAATPMS